MLQSQLRRVRAGGFLSGLVVGSLGSGLYMWATSSCTDPEQSPPLASVATQTRQMLARDMEDTQRGPAGDSVADCDGSSSARLLLYGEPRSERPLAKFSNHVVGYDAARKVPRWVLEHIDKSTVKGEASRRHSRFGPDPETSALFSASDDDYRRSGWSRGHMAPAGNNKHSQRAMDETFFYTNIVPQDIDNNSGFWNRLEMFCRQLTREFDDVNIVSGPLFLPSTDSAGSKRYVKYQVIGEGEVAVPTHLYKVVVASSRSDRQHPHVGVFVVPNEPIASRRTLEEFKWPLHELERRVGVTFFEHLDRASALDLCQTTSCVLPAHDDVERPYIERRLSAARSQQQLDKAWIDFQRRKVAYTARSVEIYEERQRELNQHQATRGEL